MKKELIKTLSLVFILIALLLTIAFKVSCHAEEICYDAGIVSKMVVEIEQCRNEAEQSSIKNGMIDSLNGQLSIREQEFSACTEGYQKCMNLMERKDALCDARVKDAKPTFKDKAVWAGIGAVIVSIVKLLIVGL